MRILVSLLLTLIAVEFTLAAPLDWQTYRHPERGFSIALPVEGFSSAPTGRGVTLLEAEGRGQIDVYGAANAAGLTPREFEAALLGAERIREVTYSRRGASWFVISGYYHRENDTSDDLIFYAKFMFSPDGATLSAFEASYPLADRVRFDPIIERMEDTLTRPD